MKTAKEIIRNTKSKSYWNAKIDKNAPEYYSESQCEEALIQYASQEIEKFRKKANKWDALDKKISKYYVDENGEPLPDDEGGDLGDIGEAAAIAFGYL